MATVDIYKHLQVTYNYHTYWVGPNKIVADIKPSLAELIQFLSSRNIITVKYSHGQWGYFRSSDWPDQKDIYVDSTYVPGIMPVTHTTYSARTSRGIEFLNATKEFCDTRWNFQLSARAYISDDNAIKKIRKELNELYPSPPVLKDFTDYLKDKHLIY